MSTVKPNQVKCTELLFSLAVSKKWRPVTSLLLVRAQICFCAFPGSDPPGDEDLRCETRDLESVECRWNEGRNTMVEVKSQTRYELDGR